MFHVKHKEKKKGRPGRPEMPEGLKRVSVSVRLDPECYKLLKYASRHTTMSSMIDKIIKITLGRRHWAEKRK